MMDLFVSRAWSSVRPPNTEGERMAIMTANVYALVEARGDDEKTSFDLYAVWGTFDEALNHYERIKGRRPKITNPPDVVTDPVTKRKHPTWRFDEDERGWAWISRYEVPISEPAGP